MPIGSLSFDIRHLLWDTPAPTTETAAPIPVSATAEQILDFQNGIKGGDAAKISKLIQANVSVNDPLPNGELPLHFAIRTGQKEVAEILVRNGANPEAKDFQNLSAIDHAVLMGNKPVLASILGNKIGKDMKEVGEQIKCKGSARHVNQLLAKLQKMGTIDLQVLNPVNKAAYQGNVHDISFATINLPDANGLTPIHYAILGNQVAAVEKLIKLGANLQILTPNGDSLLHFAAIAESPEILAKLIASKVNINCSNRSGETALHYAAAKEKLSFVQTLIRGGADLNLKDNVGMSPLALFGASAYQRDPLSLPATQVLLFASSALMFAGASGLINPDYSALLLMGSVVVSQYTEFANLLNNLDKSWKKSLAWLGFFGFAALPPLNIGFQAWKTYHVAYSALQGLKNCWKNLGYRNWAVARNAVVYSANTANSMHTLYATCKITYQLWIRFQKMFTTGNTGDNHDHYSGFGNNGHYKEENFDDWFHDFNDRFRQQRKYRNFEENFDDFFKNFKSKHRFDDVDPLECEKVNPKTLMGLSVIDRLRKPELNPECPDHALMMINPQFTIDRLRENGEKLYKHEFRQVMKMVHPDKAGTSKVVAEASMRLNNAGDTLKDWVGKNL
ncbi:MAG: ankyrin repeat domain-containing protein [Verrucomicrobia bacterium]|nr:ankyrin repeat domain-containing protein [Verrucomicrobiota bacterium]